MATLPLAAIIASGGLAACSGSDSDKVPMDEWVRDVCALAHDATDDVDALESRILAIFFDDKFADDNGAIKDELLDIFRIVRDSRDDLADDFGKLDQPDMQDGKAIRDLMHERLEDNGDDVDEAIEQIEKLDPGSENFEDDLFAVLEGPDPRDPLRTVLEERGEKNDDIAALLAAFDGDPECAAIVLDGGDPGDPAPEASETATTPAGTATAQATPARSATPAASATAPGGATGTGQTSRANPAPIGTAVEIAGWRIVVNSVTPDATDDILDDNTFNDPPEAGRQFFIANISATYINTEMESSSLFFDLDLSALGPSAVQYDGFDDYCGTVPDEIDAFKEVFEGGTITGNVCWSVRTSDAAELLMWAEAFLGGDERAWFSLQR